MDAKGTRDAAEAYLKFLYTDEGQEILAKHHYRPYKPEVLAAHADSFPQISLFSIKDFAGSWENAEKKFFAADGVFDRIMSEMTAN